MNLFRIVFLLCLALAIGGAGYLSHYGVWRDSTDITRSIRTGTYGPSGVGGRVK